MKIGLILLFLLVVLLVPSIYWYAMSDGEFKLVPLSGKNQDWAAIGSYIGGVLGPFFALITITYIGLTFKQQQKHSEELSFNQSLEQVRHQFDRFEHKFPMAKNVLEILEEMNGDREINKALLMVTLTNREAQNGEPEDSEKSRFIQLIANYNLLLDSMIVLHSSSKTPQQCQVYEAYRNYFELYVVSTLNLERVVKVFGLGKPMPINR